MTLRHIDTLYVEIQIAAILDETCERAILLATHMDLVLGEEAYVSKRLRETFNPLDEDGKTMKWSDPKIAEMASRHAWNPQESHNILEVCFKFSGVVIVVDRYSDRNLIMRDYSRARRGSYGRSVVGPRCEERLSEWDLKREREREADLLNRFPYARKHK